MARLIAGKNTSGGGARNVAGVEVPIDRPAFEKPTDVETYLYRKSREMTDKARSRIYEAIKNPRRKDADGKIDWYPYKR